MVRRSDTRVRFGMAAALLGLGLAGLLLVLVNPFKESRPSGPGARPDDIVLTPDTTPAPPNRLAPVPRPAVSKTSLPLPSRATADAERVAAAASPVTPNPSDAGDLTPPVSDLLRSELPLDVPPHQPSWPPGQRPARFPLKTPPGVFFQTMYVSFGTLQGIDAGTTLVGLRFGAGEANPLIRPLADRPAAFVAAKLASIAGTVYLVEKARARSPKLAAVTIVALNGVYAGVAIRNYHIMRARETSPVAR